MQYRAAVGYFYLKCLSSYNDGSYFWSILYLCLLISLYISRRILILSNDVHPNPGPVSTPHNYTQKPINICQANVRSLVAELDSNYKKLKERPPKVVEIETFVKENNISIMCLSETWCKSEHKDELISIEPLPKLFRRDRCDDRTGGGLLVYATGDINIKRLENIEPEESEIICLEYQLPNKINKFAFLCICYRPSDRDIISFCTDLMELHEYTADKGYYNVMFLGDFNCKNQQWCNSDTNSLEGRILKTLLDTNGYKQLVSFPTRFDINHNRSSCLDFIITNETSYVSNIESFGPIANSDHIPVSFSISPNPVSEPALIPYGICTGNPGHSGVTLGMGKPSQITLKSQSNPSLG